MAFMSFCNNSLHKRIILLSEVDTEIYLKINNQQKLCTEVGCEWERERRKEMERESVCKGMLIIWEWLKWVINQKKNKIIEREEKQDKKVCARYIEISDICLQGQVR